MEATGTWGHTSRVVVYGTRRGWACTQEGRRCLPLPAATNQPQLLLIAHPQPRDSRHSTGCLSGSAGRCRCAGCRCRFWPGWGPPCRHLCSWSRSCGRCPGTCCSPRLHRSSGCTCGAGSGGNCVGKQEPRKRDAIGPAPYLRVPQACNDLSRCQSDVAASAAAHQQGTTPLPPHDSHSRCGGPSSGSLCSTK